MEAGEAGVLPARNVQQKGLHAWDPHRAPLGFTHWKEVKRASGYFFSSHDGEIVLVTSTHIPLLQQAGS